MIKKKLFLGQFCDYWYIGEADLEALRNRGTCKTDTYLGGGEWRHCPKSKVWIDLPPSRIRNLEIYIGK